MNQNSVRQITHSWEVNAPAWTEAVRQGKIPSRQQTTNAAIVDAILEYRPRRVLDLGCGEGWLARALARHGIDVVGIDACSSLIQQARASGGGSFYIYSYSEFADVPDRVGTGYDGVVCNFALFEEDISPMLHALHTCLAPLGTLFIQTVHPWTARGEKLYRDEWRTETFADLGDGFIEPMPWYFRTLTSWIQVLQVNNYKIEALQEPLHPDTGEPLSLLLIAAHTV